MTHAEIIQKNYDVLLRCTTVNYYVIDFLKSENVLDRIQEAELKETKNSVKQRILLFQWLQEFPLENYESFLQVMNDTEQEHVTNLLRGRTEEGHLPLLNARHDRLEKIRHKIAHVICTDSELIAELRSFKAISKIDADEIRAEKGEYVKSSKLISAIMRRSNQCYNSFQDALCKTLQTAAAEFLNEGEMPAVHLNNKRPELDENLSFTFNEAIRNNTGSETRIKELITEMNGFDVHPVKAVPGQSIVIFFYCKTVQSAVKFTQLFNSRKLQYLLDRIFNRLLLMIEPHNTKELNSIISLEDEEIDTLEDFTGIEGWKTQSLGRLKNFGKKSERDATTQTDDNVTKTEITDFIPDAMEEITAGPTVIYSAEAKTESQIEEEISGAEIEGKTSWSSAESSVGAEIADVDSDVYEEISAEIERLIPRYSATELADVDSDVDYAAASRKLYWKQEKRTFYRNFEYLLTEEEELLNFFHREMAKSDDSDKGWDWEQRRTTLSRKLESLLDIQNNILKLLIPSETSSTDGLRQVAKDIDDKLKQHQQSWKNLKEQVLSKHTESKPSTFQSTYSKSSDNIELRFHEVQFLKRALKKSEESTGKEDIFSELENLMVEESKKKPQSRDFRTTVEPLSPLERSKLSRQWSNDSEDEFLGTVPHRLSSYEYHIGRSQISLLEEPQNEDDVLKKLPKHQTPTVSVEIPVKFRSDPVLVQTIRTKDAEKRNKPIRGMAILDKELFVVTERSSVVEVYDSIKFSFSRRWNLRELTNPQDIGSCNRNKCLYFIDFGVSDHSNEILRVDPNGKLIKIWSTEFDFQWSLSVTDESNVILALYTKRKLEEYSPDGQLIREINLSTDAGKIYYPRHAIKLTNGHFAVVSHGSDYDDQHTVSIVDANGKLQKSFGGTQGSTIVQMNSPVYLSVDSSGFVMVADPESSRILLLDPDLEFMKELLSEEKHRLLSPQRILLDESNGRLFVADNGERGGRVKIFSLTPSSQRHSGLKECAIV